MSSPLSLLCADPAAKVKVADVMRILRATTPSAVWKRSAVVAEISRDYRTVVEGGVLTVVGARLKARYEIIDGRAVLTPETF